MSAGGPVVLWNEDDEDDLAIASEDNERCGHGHQIGDCPDPGCFASHQSQAIWERDD